MALIASLVRGDRVLRIGTVGASVSTLPWAMCSGFAACTSDPLLATRLLRIGNGPVALVGPGLLLVLLGVSGQLERHRWVARTAGLVGLTLCALCWATPWTISSVHPLRSGIFYPDAAPLTGLHFSQIGIWLGVGIVIARRTVLGGGERKRLVQMLIGVLALGAVGMTDMLLIYRIAGSYPIAWLPALLAAVIAGYYELTSDLLRPQGFDRDAAIEIGGFVLTVAICTALAYAVAGATPVTYAVGGGVVWIAVTMVTWMLRRDETRPIARERALAELVAKLTDVETAADVVAALGALWAELGIGVRSLVAREDGDALEWLDPSTGDRRALPPDLATWLVDRGELVASGDLGTMRLGTLRPDLESLLAAAGGGEPALVVPLVDRGALVGLVEATHTGTLRESERGLVSESARAAARALGYVSLSRAAALERETAREVEVADAMRAQASASRDTDIGRWVVAAEYRSATHTTGAGWSTTLLSDGRLAMLVTEATSRGVAAALATAAVTGAFAAATTGPHAVALETVLASLRSSAEGVVRGGEPVAAFLAIVDVDAGVIEWASAGHPGAAIVSPVSWDVEFPAGSTSGPRPTVQLLGGGGGRLGATLATANRGRTPFGPDGLLVVTSSVVRGDDDTQYEDVVRDRAPAGTRLAQALVDAAARRGPIGEDLLAVVVRQRPERRSRPRL